MYIFFWGFREEIIYLLLLLLFLFFLAWLLHRKSGCDDLPGGVTPQASMKLSPPHRSPALPRRGPSHHPCLPRCRRCSPPHRRCSPTGMAGAAGTAGTAGTVYSPAQDG